MKGITDFLAAASNGKDKASFAAADVTETNIILDVLHVSLRLVVSAGGVGITKKAARDFFGSFDWENYFPYFFYTPDVVSIFIYEKE